MTWKTMGNSKKVREMVAYSDSLQSKGAGSGVA